jgi:hypothetical protein
MNNEEGVNRAVGRRLDCSVFQIVDLGVGHIDTDEMVFVVGVALANE